MNKQITEQYVQKIILDYLKTKGWDYNVKAKAIHEHGCDIIVTDSRNKNKARRFYIERKGKSYSKSTRSVSENAFVYSLGQLMTRMKVIARHAYKYGIGLPENSANKALRRIPWQVARHLCLYVFSVDDNGNVKEYSPKDFKRIQKGFRPRNKRGILQKKVD